MANKYSSNIRTIVAKNLLWDYDNGIDTGVAPTGLKTIAPPANFNVVNAGLTEGLFRANWGNIDPPYNVQPSAWIVNSNMLIKSLGIFSNFADGLVMSNIARRLSVVINSYAISIDVVNNGYVNAIDFTADSNEITVAAGRDLHALINADASYPSFIGDVGGALDYSIVYLMSDVAVDGLSARISDYGYRTINGGSFQYAVTSFEAINPVTVPLLNVMFQQELLIKSGIPYPAVTTDTVPKPIYQVLTAKIVIQPTDSFDFYTHVVSPDFDRLPVTFDVVAEVEVTPSTLTSPP
jgi:hypothetical protein